MYRAFLYQEGTMFNDFDGYLQRGEQLFAEQRNQIEKTLSLPYIDNYTLDGQALVDEWFPGNGKAHVFLSHSHADKDLIYKFSGFLYIEFGIISFIDSAVWGYADDLLKLIDNEFALNEKTGHYDYKIRNKTTSNIYLLLNNALFNMMNQTECVIFIDTPNSITRFQDRIADKTYSPWIYSELNMLNKLKINIPQRHIREYFEKSASTKPLDVKIEYDVTELINHLPQITDFDLQYLKKNKVNYGIDYPEKNLDKLYELIHGTSRKS